MVHSTHTTQTTWKWWGLLLLVLLAGGSLGGQQAKASEDPSTSVGFSYNALFPENQVSSDVGYYDLMVSPGQSQTLQVAISNPSTEAITVDVAINGAKTNSNGVIEYGDNTIENDASLAFDFSSIVTGPASLDIPAGETRNLDLQVQMPETGFDGQLAGGIQLKLASDTTTSTESSGGSTVVNEYAYIIGVLLQESDTVLTPDLTLNQVYAGQTNYRNAIFVNFSNTVAAFLNEMTVEVQVHTPTSDAVLYETKQTNMRMAPNTFITFPVSMNGERMTAGTYVADILVTSGDQRWEWSQEFEITEEDAAKYNERDVGLVQEAGLDWTLIALVVAGILLVMVTSFIGIRWFRKKRQARPKKKGSPRQTLAGTGRPKQTSTKRKSANSKNATKTKRN